MRREEPSGLEGCRNMYQYSSLPLAAVRRAADYLPVRSQHAMI